MKRLLGVTVVALAADWGTKALAAARLSEKNVRMSGLLELRCMKNTGMALGFLAGSSWASFAMPLAAMGVSIWLMRQYQPTRYTRMCWGLIGGGFLGNFIQRIVQGYVLDMLFFPWLPWFVCNVADICICFGVALLALSLLTRPQDWIERRETKDAKS